METSVVALQIFLGESEVSCMVRGEPHVVEDIETTVEGGVLSIAPRSGSSFSTNEPLEVRLCCPGISDLSVSSAGRVQVSGLDGESFQVEATSAARVTVSGKTGSLKARAESAGSVDVTGVQTRSISTQAASGGRILS